LLRNATAFVMARRPCGDCAGTDPHNQDLVSLYLLPAGSRDRIWESLQPVVDRPDANLFFLCDFHASTGRERELMIVEGPWEALDLAMKLVREAIPDPAGFFFCLGQHLPFEVFWAPLPAQTPAENPARDVEPDPPAPTPG
jgi:hypothetical protein